jgi:hypothetical protein
MISYRVITDGDWFVVVRDEDSGSRVLARYLVEVEARQVCCACERATGAHTG